MIWMRTWQHFLEARLGTCVESWVEQKARPNPQDKPRKYLYIKYSWSNFNDTYIPYFNSSLRLKSWDFASMLVLANMRGTWDFVWTNHYNNFHTCEQSLQYTSHMYYTYLKLLKVTETCLPTLVCGWAKKLTVKWAKGY